MRIERYRVRHGDLKALSRHRTDETGGFASKKAGHEYLKKGIRRLAHRQELLYAQNEYALLLIFQGMDAAGKDSAIKHVMAGVNPQATSVHSFKRPSEEELSHDFLWRAVLRLPARGRIGIFNRSYYEEVLVVRVHADVLKAERLPAECVTPSIWTERYEDINAFERHMHRNGTVIRKFFLNVSPSEQRKRLLERLDDPSKNWKFSPSDVPERARWDAYMSAYRQMLAETSQPHAPWYIVPADHKWFAHALIAEVVVQTLDSLDLSFPKLSPEQRRELERGRRLLKRPL